MHCWFCGGHYWSSPNTLFVPTRGDQVGVNNKWCLIQNTRIVYIYIYIYVYISIPPAVSAVWVLASSTVWILWPHTYSVRRCDKRCSSFLQTHVVTSFVQVPKTTKWNTHISWRQDVPGILGASRPGCLLGASSCILDASWMFITCLLHKRTWLPVQQGDVSSWATRLLIQREDVSSSWTGR